MLSVIAGIVLASLVVNVMDALSTHLYPLPAGASDSADSMRQAVRSLPRPAFLIILIGWVTGAAVGAYAACEFSGRKAKWPGIAVGLIVLVAAVVPMFALPHPRWLWAAAIVFVPAAGVAGSRFALRHPPDMDPL